MKKILVTLSLIAFVAFISNAQTTPVATSKETKTEASTTAAPTAKKSGCCHKGMSSADCKNKSAKNCTKAGADSKVEKTSATGTKSN